MPGLFFRSRLPMRQALLIVDVQPCFAPPDWLLEGIGQLLGRMPSVASVERHDESRTPFPLQFMIYRLPLTSVSH